MPLWSTSFLWHEVFCHDREVMSEISEIDKIMKKLVLFQVDVTVSFPDEQWEITVPYATVHLEQLPPSTNHTLHIYQRNKHGKSQDMLTLHVKTQGKNIFMFFQV